MITPEEKKFIDFWAVRRVQKKRFLRQFTIGLPLGVLFIAVLFVNILSGWHKTAAMALQNNASLVIVILLAALGIVIFMTVFSHKHEWDRHEQRYQELLQKQNQSDSAAI